MPLVVETYSPNLILKPFIKNYHVVVANSDVENYVIPDIAPVMIFRFRGKLNQEGRAHQSDFPLFAVSGLRNSARLFKYSSGSSHIVVRLNEGFANVFFRESPYVFYKDSVALSDLSDYNDFSKLEDQLSEMQTNKQRIILVESFLASRIRVNVVDKQMVAAVANIVHANGNVRIDELANQHHLSQDAFEKRFRRIVGAPPKSFANIVRLKTLIAKGIDGKSLTEISIEAGFFDQPHFNRDFKLFTGQSPSRFFQQKQRW